ncbi:MAG: bis(5'-nucleosyl)-tetraphosphatase (symmetrical) YqeK [Desulfitobacteriia bacterium]|jgi:predicted HD superfamily hydrolase involved in NAD metabolism
MVYDFEKFRALAKEKLDSEKYKHTLGVETWAVELARKHGLDENSARLAGLAHDLAKNCPLQEQITKASEWGLIHFPEDFLIPAVLHGRLAARILEEKHEIYDRDILNAIANHTLGRPGMSRLEMLIYSADLTEPGRDFPEVDILRQKLYHDLKEGTLACMEHTIKYLEQRQKAIHPLTRCAYSVLKNHEI